MSITAAIVAKLAELFTTVTGCSRTVRFNGNVHQHLIAVSLHGTILEITRGCVQLLRIGDGEDRRGKGRWFPHPPVVG